MPRTTTLEFPGCPPLRALSFDTLGLVKVIEARSKEGGVAKVVERWGEPDASKCVLAASFDDSERNPLLSIARKNGLIEGLSPVNGELYFSIPSSDAGNPPEDDRIVGLHLFKKLRSESPSRSCTLLTCTTKGKACMRTVQLSSTDTAAPVTREAWNVCGSGDITLIKVSGDESHSVFGGKGVELNMWDLEKTDKIWSAKSPPKNNLGIFTPTWFTSVTFLSKDDHRKVVSGTNNNQVRLYDISAQRRPVLSVNFRETPITAVAEDIDGYTIYVGNGFGDLGSIDIRTGKLLGCFIGKCSGSIRSIAKHPQHPVIASCGLDSFVRFWDTNTRQPLSAVYLKQHLTSVVFDSNFSDEEVAVNAAEQTKNEVPEANGQHQEAEDEEPPIKRKKARKESSDVKKLKSKKKAKKAKLEAAFEES